MTPLDKFKKITGYDVSKFISDYGVFLSSYYPIIVKYYEGVSTNSKQAFEELKRLLRESKKISEIISINRDSLSETIEFWDLVENLTTARVRLETAVQTPKWIRSSYYYGYENRTRVNKILKQRQTVENLSIELGSNTPNEDWVELAISNSLLELDYTKDGGNSLQVNFSNDINLSVTSVVDLMIGRNIIGKDIDNEFVFEDDDIKYLDPDSTAIQSAEINLSILRGSVPEFPFVGIPEYLVGSNVSSLLSFSMSREIYNNFSGDDTFSRVELLGANKEKDNMFYKFKIVTVLNDEINKEI